MVVFDIAFYLTMFNAIHKGKPGARGGGVHVQCTPPPSTYKTLIPYPKPLKHSNKKDKIE